MKLKWKDNNTKIMGVSYVTDDDAAILQYIGYFNIPEEDVEDENGELIEIWAPLSQLHYTKIGKWVAFKQEGMSQILHGKVERVYGTCLAVKCKNRNRRYVSISECYKFFDNKEECYAYK